LLKLVGLSPTLPRQQSPLIIQRPFNPVANQATTIILHVLY
jgi:hypothetical protein